jgi:4-hydroxy-tetrahydrodipicolinate synthase
VAFQQNIDGYVAVEKYLLVKQGIFESVRQRGPVRTILSSEVKIEIDQIFEKLVKMVNN